MKKMKNTNKKLNIEKRLRIQAYLEKQMSTNEIAKALEVNRSSITREISRGKVIKNPGKFNGCLRKSSLGLCNGCSLRQQCTKRKEYYDYYYAEIDAQNKKRINRNQTKISYENLQILNKYVVDGLMLKQSLYHIIESNPEIKNICSESTLRRLLYKNYFDISPAFLPRYSRFKRSRNSSNIPSRIKSPSNYIDRDFRCYTKYKSEHPDLFEVQLDSVIGKRTDKSAILTIMWPKFNFQLGIKILKGDPRSVNNYLKTLFSKVSLDQRRAMFGICLADNGTEFDRLPENEYDENGEFVCKTFYTRPYTSTDKSSCERNHEFFRYIVPKGKTLDNLTQEDINYIFSQINSYSRRSKNGKTPSELALEAFGMEFLNSVGIEIIPKNKVKLSQLI